MSQGWGRFVGDQLASALAQPEDAAILTGQPRRPEAFTLGYTPVEVEPDAELLAWPWEEPIPFVIPPPFQRNEIMFLIDTDYAIAVGLVEPPEGYVPPTPPPIPWRRRIRMRISTRVMRIRMCAANRLAGFDVEADRW